MTDCFLTPNRAMDMTMVTVQYLVGLVVSVLHGHCFVLQLRRCVCVCLGRHSWPFISCFWGILPRIPVCMVWRSFVLLIFLFHWSLSSSSFFSSSGDQSSRLSDESRMSRDESRATRSSRLDLTVGDVPPPPPSPSPRSLFSFPPSIVHCRYSPIVIFWVFTTVKFCRNELKQRTK